MNVNSNYDQYDDEIDLTEILEVVWSHKLFIIFISALFALGSIFFALSIPNQYKATALLAPAQSDGNGLSSTLGQLSGLASLAGVSIGASESSESQIAQEIMKSWSFAESFIAGNNLVVEIYAATGWSKNSKELEFNEDLYDASNGGWLIDDAENGGFRAPTSWEVFERFKEMLTVSEDPQSGLVTISIEYYSPNLAKKWVDLYVSAINEHMQTRQVAKVTSNIRYLEDQITKTSIAEMKEVFYTIIEEQTKNKMVAEASPDYAFLTVSPSMVPEEKSQPNRGLICILVTLIGGMMSLIFVLMRHFVFS